MTASRLAALPVLMLASAVFWATAYPSITWWDSSSYSLAAATLGITSPPGSILLTLLGWPIATFAGQGQTAYLLNLFAGLLAARAAALTYFAALELQRLARDH